MTRIHLLSRLAVICVFISMSGCTGPRWPGKVDIDQSSPEALARSYRQAFEENDEQGLLQCVDPPERPMWRAMHKALEERTKTIELLRDKIGEEEAKMFDSSTDLGITVPFSEAAEDGKVNWSRVQFPVAGDSGVIEVDGQEVQHFWTIRIENKWYLTATSPSDRQASLSSGVEFMTSLFTSRRDSYRKLQQSIRRGQIGKENIHDDEWTEDDVPLGPEVDGAAIRILPRYTPIYREGDALTFDVSVYRTSDNRPLCWRVPANGLGENTTLEIDGRVISPPEDKTGTVHGWFTYSDMPAIHLAEFTLPSDLYLKEGPHTIRYSIRSDGNFSLAEDGTQVPLFKGTLVSNTLTFFIR